MWLHLIEDGPELREVMSALITSEGHRAICFESAEAYLDFFSSPKYIAPAAIITDNRLPGMNGADLVKCIRQRLPSQKIVITTATIPDIKPVTAELCYELPKPFMYEELKALISDLAACTTTHDENNKYFEHAICEFGLEHLCPFATAAPNTGENLLP